MRVGDIVIIKENPDIGVYWQGKRATIISTDNGDSQYFITLRLPEYNDSIFDSGFEPTDFTPEKEYNVKKLLTKLKL